MSDTATDTEQQTNPQAPGAGTPQPGAGAANPPQGTPQTEPETDPLAFTLDEIDDIEEPGQGTDPQGGANEEPAEYKIEVLEEYNMNTGVHEYITGQARELGIQAGAMSKLLNNTLGWLRDAEQKERQEALQALKKEWGADFDKRAAATKKFTLSIAKAAGLTHDDAAMLSSPNGYRLMYGISRIFSETRAAGGTSSEPMLTAEMKRQMAEDMRRNPKNEFNAAFTSPNMPMSERKAAFKRFNELYGKKIYPE